MPTNVFADETEVVPALDAPFRLALSVFQAPGDERPVPRAYPFAVPSGQLVSADGAPAEWNTTAKPIGHVNVPPSFVVEKISEDARRTGR